MTNFIIVYLAYLCSILLLGAFFAAWQGVAWLLSKLFGGPYSLSFYIIDILTLPLLIMSLDAFLNYIEKL